MDSFRQNNKIETRDIPIPGSSLHVNVLVILAVIILFGFILRLWGFTIDLPSIYNTDEVYIVDSYINILNTGDLNPHLVFYPSFQVYLSALSYKIYLTFQSFITGSGAGAIQLPIKLFSGIAFTHEPMTFILPRLETILAGVICIVLIYHCGKELFNNPKIGLIAALLLALSPIHINESKQILPNVYVEMFILVVLLISIWIMRTSQLRYYLLAGLFVALAASAKYNGAIAFVLVLAASLTIKGEKGIKLFWSAFIAVLVFFILNYYTLVDYRSFLETLNNLYLGYKESYIFDTSGFWYFTRMLSLEGLVFIFSCLGAVICIVKKEPSALPLFFFVILYFLPINLFLKKNDRMLLLCLPIFYILAAYGFEACVQKIVKSPMSSTLKMIIPVIICAMLITPPAYHSIINEIHRAKVDSRRTATIWIKKNLPPGSKMVLEAYSPFVDPLSYQLAFEWSLGDHDPQWYIDNDFRYLVTSQKAKGMVFQYPENYSERINNYHLIFDRFQLIRTFMDNDYEILIYHVTQ